MTGFDAKSVFEKIKNNEQKNANGGNGMSSFTNPLILKPKANVNYVLRLLWLPPAADSDREYPMINSYIHKIWDEHATGSKEQKVICPTSQYMLGETPTAFKKCPICAAASQFYKEGQAGSESAEELYNTFRRTCVGYVPVYVVNGPDEDLHQVRILQYGKQFKDFFDSKIFGIVKQSRNGEESPAIDSDEVIGLDAFMYYDATNNEIINTGYDLIIQASSKKMIIKNKEVTMPVYSLDFARKARKINEIDGVDMNSNAGVKYFKDLNEAILHFDDDFYKKSTDAELQAFKTKYITKAEAIEAEEDEPIHESVKTSIPKSPAAFDKPMLGKTEEDAIGYDDAPVVAPVTNKVTTSASDDNDLPRTENGEIDINALLGGI
jgi:hypothetical protein